MREGVAREAQEELGLNIDPKDLKLVMVQSRWCPDFGKNPHARVGFYFAPTNLAQEPRNAEPDKCDDLRFFPLDALPTTIVPHIHAVLEVYKRGENYNEFDWETV
jgi:ADP-ribose pyrophosphatase YjhB (NUDIX family)